MALCVGVSSGKSKYTKLINNESKNNIQYSHGDMSADSTMTCSDTIYTLQIAPVLHIDSKSYTRQRPEHTTRWLLIWMAYGNMTEAKTSMTF